MPIVIGSRSITFNVLKSVRSSTIPDIVIAGIPIIKDILAAVCLSIPANKDAVNVIPDLETPGNKAKDCAKPIKIISLRLISIKDLLFCPYFSEIASKIAIIIEMIAIENKPL